MASWSTQNFKNRNAAAFTGETFKKGKLFTLFFFIFLEVIIPIKISVKLPQQT